MNLHLKKNTFALSLKDIVQIGIMVATLEAVKIALAGLPNIELVTLLIVIYTRHFEKKMVYVIPLFILLECFQWGIGLWTFMYSYVWFILAIITYIFRKQDSLIFYVALTGMFGLLFGFLCSLIYIFVNSPTMALSWWISGLPYDFIHCVGNVTVTLVLFKPLDRIFSQITYRKNIN